MPAASKPQDEGAALVVGITWANAGQFLGKAGDPDDLRLISRNSNRRQLLRGVVPFPDFDLV